MAASKNHLATFLSQASGLFDVAPMCPHKIACGKQTKSNVSGSAILCFKLLMKNQGKKPQVNQPFHSVKSLLVAGLALSVF